MVRRVSWFSKRFLSLTKGPSASTCLHLRKTSQYPWKLSQGAPALKLKPLVRFRFAASPLSAQSEVLRQLPFLPGSWHASSHRSLVLYRTFLSFELRKHCSIPYFKQMLPLQSPCWQTWVPPLHSVTLSDLISARGHKAVLPLQKLFSVQSCSSLHFWLCDFEMKEHVSSQHGPTLGLHCTPAFNLQLKVFLLPSTFDVRG